MKYFCHILQFLVKLPTEFKEETIVISCEDDKTSCEKAIQAGIPIVEAEFLLTGILQQDLAIDKYPFLQNFIIYVFLVCSILCSIFFFHPGLVRQDLLEQIF